MTTSDDDNTSALSRMAATLAASIEGLRKEVQKLRSDIRRNRTIARITIVGLILDVLLTVGFAYVYHQQISANTVAARQAYERCLDANKARAGENRLWHFILVAPHGPQTPHEMATIAQFTQLVHKTFKPVDCKPQV